MEISMRMKLLAMAAVLALCSATPAVLAHQGATGVVRQRMDAMKSVAAATKVLATLDWSNLAEARKLAADNARTVAGHAADMVALFPTGSTMAPSEAAAAIWEKPEEFAKLANTMGSAAEEIVVLAQTARSRTDIAVSFDKMAATCKACHSGFRVKR